MANIEQKEDLEIKPKKLTSKEKMAQDELPTYRTKIELTPEQQETIVNEIVKELDEIDKERSEEDIDGKLDECDRLYESQVQQNLSQQFDLDTGATAQKVDALTRAEMDAFFDSDPRFSITPRPEFDAKGGTKITEKQEDFLDYKFDEVIPLQEEMQLVFHCSNLKSVGILKYPYSIEREPEQREEHYDGTWEVVKDKYGRPKQNGTGPEMKNRGLDAFLANYPGADQPDSDFHGYYKKLYQGKSIDIVATYTKTTYHDPLPQSIDPKNFRCRNYVSSYKDLANSKTHGDFQTFSWWELKQMEEEKGWYNLDKLIEPDEKKEGEETNSKDYEHQPHEIYELIHKTEIDGKPVKGIFTIAREKKVMIGSVVYPYYTVPTYYIPFWSLRKKKGFWQFGVGSRLKDSHMAQNAMLNFALEGAYISNTITPITKEGSELEKQFLEKRFVHGIPITAEQGDYDFLNKYMKPVNTGEIMNLVEYLKKIDDEVTGISQGYSTGKADPVDPDAPGNKTIALLQRSGINVKDYIRNLKTSFNLIPSITLSYYYQMNQEGIQFRVRNASNAVVGGELFDTIERDEMIAKTSIQSQAMVFNFDKQNEKRENLALWQVMRQTPLIAQNPDAAYYLDKILVKSWSRMWRQHVDKILPSPEDFNKLMIQRGMQAIGAYLNMAKQQEKATGMPAPPEVKKLIPMMQQLMAEAVTPPPEAVQKERAKNAAKTP